MCSKSATSARAKNIKIISFFFLVIVLISCTQTNNQKLTDGLIDSELDPVLNDKIGVGTSISIAIEFMESEGFECHIERDSVFNYIKTENFKSETLKLEGINFVRCSRKTSRGLTALCFTEVALIFPSEEDVITNILITTECSGL